MEKSKEGKLISVMIGILEEVGLSIEDLEENALALGEEIDVLSDDLADVEAIVGEDDEDDCCCAHDLGCDDDLDDEDFFEVDCPNCGESLVIDDEVLEAGVIDCPKCGQKFALDFEGEDDECGCGCEDDDEDGDCGCGCGCEDHDHQ